MSRSGGWWGSRSGPAKLAVVVGLVVATGVLAVLTFGRSTGLGGEGASPTVSKRRQAGAPATVLTPCGRRARRVTNYDTTRAGGSDSAYQTLLHTLQRDCPGEAAKAGLAGAFLPRCRRLTQRNCTLYKAPPWFRGTQPDGPALAVVAGSARHGDYTILESAVAAGGGNAYLALQRNIRINRFSPYMFSVYLQRVRAGDLSVKLQLACFRSGGRFAVNVQLQNPRVLGPVSGVTAPTDAGFMDPKPRWARYGGLVPARACPTGTQSVKPQFFFDHPPGSRAAVRLDAVQIERGTRFSPYVPRGRNLVPDSSFESGGFTN